MRYAKNRQEAEEILQDGFMRIFKFITQFKNEGSFEGWMRKIFVNSALQKLRRQLTMHAVLNLNGDACGFADNYDIIEQLNGKELLYLVQKLSPMYRMVFNLYVFEGMKHREIAALLNIAVGTSKSHLADARRILKHTLTKQVNIAK